MAINELGFAFKLMLRLFDRQVRQQLMIVTILALRCDRVPSLRSGFQKKAI